MGVAPIPVAFQPVHHARPWGGRRINDLLDIAPSVDGPIGESIQLLDAPWHPSAVRDGAARGKTIRELIAGWGAGLLGGLRLDNAHLPLAVSLLNAESLSDVLVAPLSRSLDSDRADGSTTPTDAASRSILYMLHAEPTAEIRLGVKPDVSADVLGGALGGEAFASLLRRGPVRRGQCYQIPAGVPWALGGGVLAVRIDAGPPAPRVRLDGAPRDALQTSPAVEATSGGGGHEGRPPHWSSLIRTDLPLDDIMQQRRHVGSVFSISTRLVSRGEALVEKARLVEGLREEMAYGELTVLAVLSGRGAIEAKHGDCPYGPGDALLIPAGAVEPHVRTDSDSEWLEIKLPVASSLGGFERPPPEPPPVRSEHVPLTWGGRRLDDRRS